MSNLGAALSWKYPGVEGISTKSNVITEWPEDLGPEPTGGALQTILNDYELADAKFMAITSINDLRDTKKQLPILSEGYQVDPGTLSTGAMAVEMFAYSKSTKDISVLTSVGNVATAVFVKNHHLKNGVTVSVSGADQPEYNISGIVTVIDKKTITYPIAAPATSPATGSPIIGIATFRWITSDNQTVFWTADEFDEIFQSCTEYLDECQQRGRDLKDAVIACNTVAEIEAIDITAGWPSTGI